MKTTKDKIFKIADNLAKKGIMPSNEKIREGLGNKGSETTIHKYLKMWKEELLLKNSTSCVLCSESQKQIEEMRTALLYVKKVLREKFNIGKPKNAT